ncbi:hypothetical protein ILYODFUR_021853, partial [Ilyodon furcidens]
ALNGVRSGNKGRQQKDTLILRRGEKEGKTAAEEGTGSHQSSLSDVLPFPAVWFYDAMHQSLHLASLRGVVECHLDPSGTQ